MLSYRRPLLILGSQLVGKEKRTCDSNDSSPTARQEIYLFSYPLSRPVRKKGESLDRRNLIVFFLPSFSSFLAVSFPFSTA